MNSKEIAYKKLFNYNVDNLLKVLEIMKYKKILKLLN